jgi:uncharacterized repeat protein (TIGR03803 family)
LILLRSIRNTNGSVLLDWNDILGVNSYAIEVRRQGVISKLDTCTESQYSPFEIGLTNAEFRATCIDEEGRTITSNWVNFPAPASGSLFDAPSNDVTLIGNKLYGIAYKKQSNNVSLPSLYSVDLLTKLITFEAYLPISRDFKINSVSYSDKIVAFGNDLIITYSDGFNRRVVKHNLLTHTNQEILGLLFTNMTRLNRFELSTLAIPEYATRKQVANVSLDTLTTANLNFVNSYTFSEISQEGGLSGLSEWLSSGGILPHNIYSGLFACLSSGGAAGFGGIIDLSKSTENSAEIIALFPNLSTVNEQEKYSLSGPMTQSGIMLYGYSGTGGMNGAGCIFRTNTQRQSGGVIPLVEIIYSFNFDSINQDLCVGYPIGSPCFVGSQMFGYASAGGSENLGAIFNYGPNGLTIVKQLDTQTGFDPVGSISADENGILYGICRSGGLFGKGTLFSIDSLGNFSVLINFGSL